MYLLKSKSSGFGLLSLLIALLVTIIISFSAIISYRSFIQHHRLSAIANTLVSALSYARTQAIVSGDDMHFCPESGDSHCGKNWQKGWVVLNASTGDILRYYPSVSNQLFFKGVLGFDTDIIWRPSGLTAGMQGSFWICGASSHNIGALQITLLRTGRLRIVHQKRCG